MDDVVVWVVVDAEIGVTHEKPRQPDFVVTTDVPTLASVGIGRTRLDEAIRSGLASFEGDPDAAWRALKLLGSGATRDARPKMRPAGRS